MSTFTTKLPTAISDFLNAQDDLYGRIERDIFTRINRGESIGVVEKIMQSAHGVDSTTVRNVWHDLKGKLEAVRKLRDTHIDRLKHSISSLKKTIATKEKKLIKFQKEKKPTAAIRFELHGKKRKFARLESKLNRLIEEKKSKQVSIAFGSKKLFNAQHHLGENGYASHEEWLADWRESRSGNFLMVGNKIFAGGNQLCRLTPDGELTITVPFPLLKRFGPTITVSGVTFAYGQDWINAALTPVRRFSKAAKKASSRMGTEKPVTHRFVRKDKIWYLHTTVELLDIPTITHKRNGAIGVDLNAKSIDWAYCDNEGNLKHHGSMPIDTSEMSSDQATDALSKAIGELITLATVFECPIVIEKLDFSKKKAQLGERGKRYSRMLSQFAYKKFSDLMESKCYRSGIQLIRVNPAYSSLIGLTKYMAMYGLNSGTAAALVLARRCYRFSERLSTFTTPLVSPVDDSKHVWSHYSRISKALKGCRRHSFFGLRTGVEVKHSVDPPWRWGRVQAV